jgi:hypothetical protein
MIIGVLLWLGTSVRQQKRSWRTLAHDLSNVCRILGAAILCAPLDKPFAFVHDGETADSHDLNPFDDSARSVAVRRRPAIGPKVDCARRCEDAAFALRFCADAALIFTHVKPPPC